MVAAGSLAATIVVAWFMPKGFFPTEDIGQVSVNVEAVEDISFPAISDLMLTTYGVIKANPAVDAVVMGADQTKNGRMFIQPKPGGDGLPLEQRLESLGRDVRPLP